MRTIGLLHSGSENPYVKPVEALTNALPANVEILPRYAGGNGSQLKGDAIGLVSNDTVEVIVAAGGPEPALVAMAETKRQEPDPEQRKPVVFTTVADPVVSKLVDRLDRPGRNLTGMWGKTSELDLTRLELVNALVPRDATKPDRTLGVLARSGRDHGDDQYKVLKDRADVLGLKLRRVKVDTENDIKDAFENIFTDVVAVVVTADSFFYNLRDKVVPYARAARRPAIYQWRDFVDIGGLISFGPSILDAYRQAGVYVGRILNGEKPADMAVSAASDFELVINPITARELGIKVPRTLRDHTVKMVRTSGRPRSASISRRRTWSSRRS
jgi:putative ABC transport system substrate-binding protein